MDVNALMYLLKDILAGVIIFVMFGLPIIISIYGAFFTSPEAAEKIRAAWFEAGLDDV